LSFLLLKKKKNKERQSALQCIMSGNVERSVCFDLQSMLKGLDLDRTICRIHAVYSHNNEQVKMNPVKLSVFVELIEKLYQVGKTMKVVSKNVSNCQSTLLKSLLTVGTREFPEFLDELKECTSWWRFEKDKEGNGIFVVNEGERTVCFLLTQSVCYSFSQTNHERWWRRGVK
jgi:hypothetical protein